MSPTTQRKCPVCGHNLTPHSGVHHEQRGQVKVTFGNATFFSCVSCGNYFNICKKHGLYPAEWSVFYFGSGLKCPGCEAII